MKKFTFLFIILVISVASYAQNGISFQGIARNASGVAIAASTVSATFTIGDYSETVDIATDNFGVFSHVIGSEDLIEFNKLNFANLNENLKVEVDGTTIYDDKFNTVPYSKAAENGVPPGCIMPFAGEVDQIPDGWLLCNGSSLAKTGMYQQLFNTIGTLWGDDGTKFKLPDLRGMFLRGTNEGRTGGWADPTNRNVGSLQADDNKSHNHTGETNTTGSHSHQLGHRGFELGIGSARQGADGSKDDNDWTTESSGNHKHTLSIDNSGSEARPNNAAVLYIIKY